MGEFIGCNRILGSNRLLSAQLRWLALKYLPEGIAFPFKTGSTDACTLPPAEVLATRDENKLVIRLSEIVIKLESIYETIRW